MRFNPSRLATRRRHHHLAGALLTVGVAAGTVGCSSEGSSSSSTVTYQGLRSAVTASTNPSSDGTEGSTADGPCPVDLAGAVTSAGLAVDAPASGSAEAVSAEPADTVVQPSSSEPIVVPARAAAVLVDCTVGIAGGATIDLMLYAGEDDGAAFILLPQLAFDAHLASSAVQQIAKELDGADIGTPIELPGDSDDVSFARTTISGATSAAFILTSAGDVDRATLDTIASALDDALH